MDAEALEPDALWADVRARLDGLAESTDPQADVAAAAGLFDLLSNAEQAAVALLMFEEIKAAIRTGDILLPLHRSLLALVDPFLTNSDLDSDTRILLGKAFGRPDMAFEDEHAIAHALIDLSFRVPGSDQIWTDFFERHAHNPATRFDAFDTALAGLAPWNIDAFEDVLGREPAERWLIDRLDMFLPTLSRRFTPAQVTRLVQSVYDRCDDAAERDRLVILADAYALAIVEKRPSEVGRIPVTPEPLRGAQVAVLSEKRIDEAGTQLALDRPQIHIYRSGYTGIDTIDRFQNDLIDKIRAVAGTGIDVPSSESEGFAELANATTLRRKVIFAFPTYLTAAKRSGNLICCGFGVQRRIGILYPSGNRMTNSPNRPTTLEAALRQIMLDRGKVYCVQNYALHEIVYQVAEMDPELEAYFDARNVLLRPEHKGVPVISSNSSRNFVFLFDLAGRDELDRKRRGTAGSHRRKAKSSTKKGWIDGSRIETISHAAAIEVGVLFSKYLVDWLLEQSRWAEIEAFVSSWAAKTDFVRALKAVGVDVGGEPPPDGTAEHVPIDKPSGSKGPGLRVVGN